MVKRGEEVKSEEMRKTVEKIGMLDHKTLYIKL